MAKVGSTPKGKRRIYSVVKKFGKKRPDTKLADAREREQDQLLAIFNTVSDAMFSVSASGRIRLYNAALLSLIDTNRSLSGRHLDDILPLYDKDKRHVSLIKLLKDSPYIDRDDLSYAFEDGDEIRVHISASRIRTSYSSGRGTRNEGFICTLRDVTKAKSLEEERDEFISVVSHELRTPVAITEGTLSNVKYFLTKDTAPETLIPSIDAAHDQILLLGNMINDLGTLSRAERGANDTLETINVRELGEELYNKYLPSAQKKGLALNIDLGTKLSTVTTSRLYLEELLQNFITNAIKYTQAGSVTIAIAQKSGFVTFAVSDTGIGIGKTDLKHIFEKFYRSEDFRTRETSGTGLGLYVVMKLMRKIGTKVEVESRLNHGSTFRFSLPVATQRTDA